MNQKVTRLLDSSTCGLRYIAIVLALTLCFGCRPTARDYRFSARDKYGRGDYAGAIADYTQVLRLKPDDQEAYVFRGISRAKSGDLDGGIADCTTAIHLNPNCPAYLARGAIFGKKGDENAAIADFTEAIRSEPNSAGAYFNRGKALQTQGHYKEAIADFTESIRLDGDKAETYHAYQERASAKEAIGDHIGAMEDSNQVIRLKAGVVGSANRATLNATN